MFQVYHNFDGDKGTELFATYQECVNRVGELFPQFESAIVANLTIVSPKGTAIQEVIK